jgi:bla regulator protein BlaR1
VIQPLATLSRQCRRVALAVLPALAGLALLAHSPAATAGGAQSADRTSYVLLSEGSRSSTMSGSTDDLRRAHALRRGQEALLYVRHGGAAYVIRDAATLRRAEEIFEPQRRLGARQAELGSRQAALGSRQAALGAQQARLGAQQANATPRRAVELGREQTELGRRQNELGLQQDALGRQQSALGQEQDRLGREADAQFRTLLAEALRSGVAQRVD